MEKKALLFIYLFFAVFFLSYTKEYRLHSLLHHSRFQTSSLLHMIEDEKSSGDPWNKVSLNILSEKQSKCFCTNHREYYLSYRRKFYRCEEKSLNFFWFSCSGLAGQERIRAWGREWSEKILITISWLKQT